MERLPGKSFVNFQHVIVWVHGIVAGVYLSDSGADTFSAYIWNIWWIFVWSLCLAAVYYILKEQFSIGTVPISDAQMPKPDLDKYKQDEPPK
jgi:hypothetical protein